MVARDSVAPYEAASSPPATESAASIRPKLPPRTESVAGEAPLPSRVMMWMTPATASDPCSALVGPRTISTRSTAAVVRPEKSNAPPG